MIWSGGRDDKIAHAEEQMWNFLWIHIALVNFQIIRRSNIVILRSQIDPMILNYHEGERFKYSNFSDRLFLLSAWFQKNSIICYSTRQLNCGLYRYICEISRSNASTFDNSSPILSNKIDFKTGKWKMTRFVRGTLGDAWFQTAAGTNESINTRNVVRSNDLHVVQTFNLILRKGKKKRKKNERKTRERTL